MDLGRLSWRGIVDVEADRVALRDAEGAPHDIRDLFLLRDDIGTVREVSTEIGGGLTYTTLTWNDEDDQPSTDDQVPGLASLLRYLAEDRPSKNHQRLRDAQLSPRHRRIHLSHHQARRRADSPL